MNRMDNKAFVFAAVPYCNFIASSFLCRDYTNPSIEHRVIHPFLVAWLYKQSHFVSFIKALHEFSKCDVASFILCEYASRLSSKSALLFHTLQGFPTYIKSFGFLKMEI